MSELAVAFVWHHHQPFYPDGRDGENPMPWVRLHGVKDYYGMALHLREVPEFHCTVNLVPSLLVQVQQYGRGESGDKHLMLSRRAADGLTEEECLYLLDNFFTAHVEHMIRPHRRYYELYRKRNAPVDGASRALRRFRPADLRDLQVWSNLAWIHPLAVAEDELFQTLHEKGSGYTEEEKGHLLDRQVEILDRIIPAYRDLARSGQIELTTTPFYHPIVPLLWDKRTARDAMPEVQLPRYLGEYAEDAQVQIHRAVQYHHEVFGAPPRGMWPSEGSVCPQMIPSLHEAGIEWIATDEEILAQSTGGRVGRDPGGRVAFPEKFYRPWRARCCESTVDVVFRDHVLSDLIGFHYQRTPADRAVDDLIGRLETISKPGKGSQPHLVPVILDGENCWEFYPDGGVNFLRALYRRCAAHPSIEPVGVSDYLDRWPAREELPRLASGSWIQHNFAIWIGDEQTNRAWDLLYQARERLRHYEGRHLLERDQARRAWEEIYIAEGSDWYWWFGPLHCSDHEEVFDRLFRKHLANVYEIIGEQPPTELYRPICRARGVARHTEPKAFLDVTVDGRSTFFEWIDAGHYHAAAGGGTMAQATARLIDEVYFGFTAASLLIRIDTAGPANRRLEQTDSLSIVFFEPPETELVVSMPWTSEPVAHLYQGRQPVKDAAVRVATGRIVEIELPLSALGRGEDDPLHFYVECNAEARSVDRAPREGAIETAVPSANFEQLMWYA